jgi:hypothetical protein
MLRAPPAPWVCAAAVLSAAAALWRLASRRDRRLADVTLRLAPQPDPQLAHVAASLAKLLSEAALATGIAGETAATGGAEKPAETATGIATTGGAGKPAETAIGAEAEGERETAAGCVAALRRIIRDPQLLPVAALAEDSLRVFRVHRALAARPSRALWIRFTVQYNLFAGSVMALGSPAHAARLAAMHAAGELGCFALTERAAGVLSGLKIDTTATWDEARGVFGACARSPSPSATGQVYGRRCWGLLLRGGLFNPPCFIGPPPPPV